MSEIFVAGQRWISTPEPDLGLGIIIEAGHRRVSIAFPAADEQRTYAADRAPLSRVQFQVGDVIEVPEQAPLTVREVQELNGCLVYLAADAAGEVHPVPEQLLSAHIALHSARDRLLLGQFDHQRRFQLRVTTLEQRNRALASRSRGLLGPRVELLPHQFYIARTVGARHQPRVLLADEVGLGKTIEAGLILHQHYLEERVRRVLILVPESLVHQWLIEMRRRFNLYFSIFDEGRCRDMVPVADSDTDGSEETQAFNPFDSEQLVIASVDWLAGNPERGQQAVDAGWDMLVVDEAHHLHWQQETGGGQAYQRVEELCAGVPSVLLLTATPENTGIEGHFARLRLLDPDRYSSLQAFRDEQAGYTQINELIAALQSDCRGALGDQGLRQQLSQCLGGELMAELEASPETRVNEAIEALLDRFGTGRNLFRNSRSSVGGFPSRRLHEHPLPVPGVYRDATDSMSLAQSLQPETLLGPDWVGLDSRVGWLETFLLRQPEARVLLICAHAETARELELFLRLRRGIASAVFHEDMSLLERDRAAAYFADPEDGAQLLVCSEIGSEGRNFQFAEHLVLFDLPLNPDLLEQRIGRLDRIGRRGEVNVHVPFYEGTAQHGLLRWYRDAVAIFREPCTIGDAMMDVFGDELTETLASESAALEALIDRAAARAESMRQELHSGRNQLLELNSCRMEVARELVDAVEQEQRGEALADYLEQLADQFGLEHEDHSEHAIILRPGDHMLHDAFPHLPEEGITGTFDRRRALEREDMAFFSWEHPLLRDAMDMIVSGDMGSACLCTLPVKGLPAGSLLLEAFFNPSLQAPTALQLDRFLPGFSERVLLDNQERNLSDTVTHQQLNTLCHNLKRSLVPAVLRQVREPLMPLLAAIEKRGRVLEEQWRQQALELYSEARQQERRRLLALAERNPEISDEELLSFDRETEQGRAYLSGLSLTLNALRLAIVSQPE